MSGPKPPCAWCGGPMDPAPPDQCPPYCSAGCRQERYGQICEHGHATAAEYRPCWEWAAWGPPRWSLNVMKQIITAPTSETS